MFLYFSGISPYRITYTDQWGDKEYVVVPPDPHTSGVHYSFRDDGKACFVATGFAPETAYTISLSPIKFDEEGEVAQATATTLKDAEYPVFIGQPQNAFVEAGASDAVSFSTVVAKPAMEGASLSGSSRRWRGGGRMPDRARREPGPARKKRSGGHCASKGDSKLRFCRT